MNTQTLPTAQTPMLGSQAMGLQGERDTRTCRLPPHSTSLLSLEKCNHNVKDILKIMYQILLGILLQRKPLRKKKNEGGKENESFGSVEGIFTILNWSGIG